MWYLLVCILYYGIERCVVSVDAQIYKNWKHFVIIDAVGKTRHISQNLIEKYSSTKREFICLGHNSNNFGNSTRKLGINQSKMDILFFIDDGNIIFPLIISLLLIKILKHNKCLF